MRVRWAVALCLVVSVAVAPPAAAGNLSDAKIGDQVRIGPWAFTVVSVQDPFTANRDARAPRGEHYIALEVQGRNLSRQRHRLTVENFALDDNADPDGGVYTYLDGVPRTDWKRRVKPGGTIHGDLFYAVQDGMHPSSLTVQIRSPFGKTVRIALD